MREYKNQIIIYTRYFFKVLKSNKLSIIYTTVLPTIMMVMQASSFSKESIKQIVIPWLAYMIYVNAFNVVLEIAYLREQGYLKQYSTLIKSNSVFIISKSLVGLLLLVVSTLFFLVIASVMYQRPLLLLGIQAVLIELFIFFPLLSLNLFLLSFQMKVKTISILGNGMMVLIIMATVVVQKVLNANSFLVVLINPIALISETFSFFSDEVIGAFDIGTYIIIIAIYLLIGRISYKYMKIIPVEG